MGLKPRSSRTTFLFNVNNENCGTLRKSDKTLKPTSGLEESHALNNPGGDMTTPFRQTWSA